MRRQYTCLEFRNLCDQLLAGVPEVTIATDIIAAFPTETDDDWRETVKLCKDYNFPILFTNQFYPRPGTPAARYKPLPQGVAKTRTKELTSYFNSYTTRDHKVGREEYVLVTDVSTDKRFYVAHNKSYDQVLVPKIDAIMGRYIKVKYTSAQKHCIFADILPGALEAAPVMPTAVLTSLQDAVVAPQSAVMSASAKTDLDVYQSQWSTKGVHARVVQTKKSKKARKAETKEKVKARGIDDEMIMPVATPAPDTETEKKAVAATKPEPSSTPAPSATVAATAANTAASVPAADAETDSKGADEEVEMKRLLLAVIMVLMSVLLYRQL